MILVGIVVETLTRHIEHLRKGQGSTAINHLALINACNGAVLLTARTLRIGTWTTITCIE